MDLIENYRLGEIHFNNKRAAMDTDYTGTCKWLFRSARIGVSNYKEARIMMHSIDGVHHGRQINTLKTNQGAY